MSLPPLSWASTDRNVLAPIPIRRPWPIPTILCSSMPWTTGPWLLPASAWASMELLQACPSSGLSNCPGPMLPSVQAPPTSIFPPPFLYRPPVPCPCCPPSIKPFSAFPVSNLERPVECSISGSPSSVDPKRSPQSDREFRCTHCFKVYSTAAAFHMHLRTHVQGCQCPICGKSFSRHWLLQGHIRTHTGEKPFTCPRCGKAFADKSNLRAHVQTHSGLKPFICGRCGKAFALKSYLSKHEESACVNFWTDFNRKAGASR